jgi:hypothetical protein
MIFRVWPLFRAVFRVILRVYLGVFFILVLRFLGDFLDIL